MTAAVAKAEKKSTVKFLADRDDYLLGLSLSLEDFTSLVSVRYDDRWRRREWRVRGNEELRNWIYDQLQDREEAMLSDTEVIERAYEHFLEIQARRGQLNFNSVYIEGYERILIIDKKHTERAVVNIVRDCVDLQWRWATSYFVGKGGSSSPLSYRFNITKSKEDAILSGARYMKNSICNSWEYKEQGSQLHKTFVNKIEVFIDNLMGKIIQPSLF